MKRKKRTDILAKLYGETNDLLAEMEGSANAGLKKEAPHKSSGRKHPHKSSPRKGEAGGKGE